MLTKAQRASRAARKAAQEAKTVVKKGSIAKKMTVSKSDIEQAKTANQLSAMQRRIDDMPDGNRKKMMQNMLDAQRDKFEKMQSDEVTSRTLKSARAKPKEKVSLSEAPFDYNKGGMARKKYNKGGYANCGASMKPTQKSSTKMAYGGMAKKK